MITRQLNPQAIVIEDAQGEIKALIKKLYFEGKTPNEIKKAVQKVIQRAKKNLTTQALIDTVPYALFFLAVKCLRTYTTTLGVDGRQAFKTMTAIAENKLPMTSYGVPNQIDPKAYMKQVKECLDRVAKQQALDPNDLTGRNSLRNRAEMEIRYEYHLNQEKELRAKGVKLVMSSSHEDCSDRCFPWQGRVYSLDHTSGVTSDGKRYVPLEVATDIFYTTKAGITYKNGLYGFNCFDDKTEVLTDRGWLLFKDLNGGEKILTLNTETRQAEWQKPNDYYLARFDGYMKHIHNQNTSLVVTPNHDCLYFTQKCDKLRFKEAKDLTTANFLYAGIEWKGEHPKQIKLGGKDVDSELYVKFMAYWLADGSIHGKTSVGIAQTNNDAMYNELCKLPFTVWHDANRIVIHDKSLTNELRAFGTCTTKYIPKEVKNLDKSLLRAFIDAYVSTDGFVQSSLKECGAMSYHRTVFTTSKQMADDLFEIIHKAGYRPKLEVRQYKGKKVKFANGKYTINNDLYVIHINNRVNITAFKKDDVEYHGYVYCVEVPNHTLLVRRNGQIVWCGNCRHKMYEYHEGEKIPYISKKEQEHESYINQKQREYERRIRNYREKYLQYKDVPTMRQKALKARKKAIEINKQYIKFLQDNESVLSR